MQSTFSLWLCKETLPLFNFSLVKGKGAYIRDYKVQFFFKNVSDKMKFSWINSPAKLKNRYSHWHRRCSPLRPKSKSPHVSHQVGFGASLNRKLCPELEWEESPCNKKSKISNPQIQIWLKSRTSIRNDATDKASKNCVGDLMLPKYQLLGGDRLMLRAVISGLVGLGTSCKK
jgi:hypothetical protein